MITSQQREVEAAWEHRRRQLDPAAQREAIARRRAAAQESEDTRRFGPRLPPFPPLNEIVRWVGR